MSQFYVINAVLIAATQVKPGSIVDDVKQVDYVAQLRAAGALLWPATDVKMQAAVALAGKAAYRGANIAEQEDILYAGMGAGIVTSMPPTKTATGTAVLRAINRVNPTGAGFTLNLPSAVGLSPDDMVTVKNDSASTNPVVVQPVGGQTIDGAANSTISTARGTVTYVPDGANWLAFPTA